MREPQTSVELTDFRRCVHDLYRAVRDRGESPEAAWSRWRAGRDELFLSHPQSALSVDERTSFSGLSYFPHDPALRFTVAVEPVAQRSFGIGHSGEGVTAFRRIGAVEVPFAAGSRRLSVYWLEGYGGGLFLPFRDATSGESTYGGGRYLLDTVKGADLGTEDGRLVLDFNYAYHPSCVYSDRWSCPLAPPENHLDIEVRAGERLSRPDRR